MKKLSFPVVMITVLAMVSIVGLVGCDEDDDEQPVVINVVGTWDLTAPGLGTAEITLHADGTFTGTGSGSTGSGTYTLTGSDLVIIGTWGAVNSTFTGTVTDTTMTGTLSYTGAATGTGEMTATKR